VIAVATHGVFAAGADRVLQEAALDEIFVTDSIPASGIASPEVRARLTVVTATELLAEAVRRLHVGGSLGELS
jgi:ribose-phosphate pyrophosphokinase